MAASAPSLTVLWKAKLAVLAGGVSLAALTVGLSTQDIYAYAAASAAGEHGQLGLPEHGQA